MRGHSDWAALCRLTIAGTALFALAACQESRDAGNPQEMAWAKAALERNPNLEVIATDSERGVFTVRDRVTQQVHAVALDELAAAPVGELAAGRAATDMGGSSLPVDDRVVVTDRSMTNRHLAVRWDGNGAITSIIAVHAARELLPSGARAAVLELARVCRLEALAREWASPPVTRVDLDRAEPGVPHDWRAT